MSESNDSPDPRNTFGLAEYPSTGAYSHLPIRTTITGEAIAPHPNATKIFLRNLPGHCYMLPNVPLNFTLVEITVLLPNWFKNRDIALRFMSNHLTANIHFAIFEEHRKCHFKDPYEREKAKKTIADQYRKAMRSHPQNMGWTKARHTGPSGWNAKLIGMDGFVPDDARLPQYHQLPSVPLRDLMIGVKKLPEGTNAGDLTRCVQFARMRPEGFVFPDDLPRILDHVGRTEITTAHTDRPIVRAYANHLRKRTDAKRPQRDWVEARERATHATREKMREGVPQPQSKLFNLQDQVKQNFADDVPQYFTPPPPVMATPSSVSMENQLQPAAAAFSAAELDTLLRFHVQEGVDMRAYPASQPLQHHPRRLLRECIEGHVAFDGSPLARAARFSQQHDQFGTEWYVENVSMVVQLLDSAPRLEAGFQGGSQRAFEQGTGR